MATNVLQSDAEIVDKYDEVLQPELTAALQSIQGLSWASFSLSKDSSRYALKVSTTDPLNSKWKEAADSLKAVFLKSTKQALDVNVIEAKWFTETRHVAPGAQQPYERGGKNPFGLYSIGRSIGVEQLNGPGTLGGLITISIEGKPRVYGLTNNHVVNVGKTTNQQSGDPTYVEKDNTIYCPNYQDLEATKIALGDDKIRSYKLGQLRGASGRTLFVPQGASNPCLLDWALIDLNTATLRDIQESDRKLKPNFELARTDAQIREHPYPTSISYDPNIHLVPGMEVFKWGRTTGVGSGEVNMTRKVMKIADVETWKGSIYNPNGDVTVAELFVPPRRLEPFCQPGDSGSLVVDGEGHLVGLLWSLADDDTIVTDIRVVFESIREKMELKADTVFGVPTKF